MLRILVLFLSLNLLSDVNKFIDASSKKYDQLALDLWDYAEMGYQEVKSSNALKKVLKEEGFSIRSNIAGIPTAFIAEYNNGGPIIAILAEYDALPGLSQIMFLIVNQLEEQLDMHAVIIYLVLVQFMQLSQ